MLPILNTNSVINNNVLYIEDAPYSMTNIMPEFNISDYMFNMYNDNDFLGLSDSQILVAYSYLYNTFVNLESGRFIPFLSKNIVLMIIRIYLKNI